MLPPGSCSGGPSSVAAAGEPGGQREEGFSLLQHQVGHCGGWQQTPPHPTPDLTQQVFLLFFSRIGKLFWVADGEAEERKSRSGPARKERLASRPVLGL